MNEIIKLGIVSVILVVLYTVIRTCAPAYAPLISVAGAAAVMAVLWHSGGCNIFYRLTELRQQEGNVAFACLFKSAGILLITDYCCGICKDAGQASTAVCMEFAGRCLVLMTAWPVFSGVFQMIGELTS